MKGRAARYEAFLGENDEILLKKTQETTTLSYNESTGQSRDWYLEAALNYSRKFGHHNVSALAMYNSVDEILFILISSPGFPVVTLDLWDVPLMTIRLAIWWISVSVTRIRKFC